ncbi:hypothetical protein LSAT2_010002 [Lamellibrachia satsuma]|nr:hypothetical protein LSAT2_010002 [Lamellibrachia satsuma]
MGRIHAMFITKRWCVLFTVAINSLEIFASNNIPPHQYSASVKITYADPTSTSGATVTEKTKAGIYGSPSNRNSEWGWVFPVRSANGEKDGCQPTVNVPSSRWVALIERGTCKFHDKIFNAAVVKNAVAAVVYDNTKGKDDPELLTMEHNVEDIVAVFISQSDGQHIAQLVDNGTAARMYITFDKAYPRRYSETNNTAIVVVCMTFIALFIVTTVFLTFYFVKWYRKSHANTQISAAGAETGRQESGRKESGRQESGQNVADGKKNGQEKDDGDQTADDKGNQPRDDWKGE